MNQMWILFGVIFSDSPLHCFDLLCSHKEGLFGRNGGELPQFCHKLLLPRSSHSLRSQQPYDHPCQVYLPRLSSGPFPTLLCHWCYLQIPISLLWLCEIPHFCPAVILLCLCSVLSGGSCLTQPSTQCLGNPCCWEVTRGVWELLPVHYWILSCWNGFVPVGIWLITSVNEVPP